MFIKSISKAICSLFICSILFNYSTADPGLDLLEAALLNSAAIVNYDVTLDEWENRSEPENGEGKFEELEKKVKRRIVMDYENQRCIELRRTTWSRDPGPADAAHRKAGKPKSEFSFFAYQDGIATAAPFGAKIESDQKLTFWKFLQNNRVPNVPLTNYHTYGAPHSGDGDNNLVAEQVMGGLRQYMAKYPADIKRLPDGTVFAKWTDGVNVKSYTFDPDFRSPKSESWIQKNWVKVLTEVDRVDRKLEVVKGIERAKSVTYFRDTVGLVSAYNDDTVQVLVHGTADLRWHQFNEEELRFPDTEKLLMSVDLMNALLDE